MGLKEAGLRGSLRSVSTEVPAIPDSAIYYWQTPISGLSEGDPVNTWPAEVGGEDISGDGLTYRVNAVDDRDGVEGDGADTGEAAIGDFATEILGDFSVGISFTADGDGDLIGVGDDNLDQRFVISIGTSTIGVSADSGDLGFRIRDENDNNRIEFTVDGSFSDGQVYNILMRKDGDAADDFEVIINGINQDLDFDVDDTLDSFSAFSDPVGFYDTYRHDTDVFGGDGIDGTVSSFRFYDDYVESDDPAL